MLIFLFVCVLFPTIICYYVTAVCNVFRLRLKCEVSKCTHVKSLFSLMCFCACVRLSVRCLCLLLCVLRQQKVGTETDKPLRTTWECMFTCHFVCMCVCVSQPVCVTFNDLFWWSGVADIEMDGPYALYGPCIFHISAAKQSRAGIAYMARMLHWDVGCLYESSYTLPTALSPLNKLQTAHGMSDVKWTYVATRCMIPCCCLWCMYLSAKDS